MAFICSICGEGATQICGRCTKDACSNHLCEKCLRCSDCCECEVALDAPVHKSVPMVREMTPHVDAEEDTPPAQPPQSGTPDEADPGAVLP